MKDFDGRELSKDEEIVALRNCIEQLKTQLLQMRERQHSRYLAMYQERYGKPYKSIVHRIFNWK